MIKHKTITLAGSDACAIFETEGKKQSITIFRTVPVIENKVLVENITVLGTIIRDNGEHAITHLNNELKPYEFMQLNEILFNFNETMNKFVLINDKTNYNNSPLHKCGKCGTKLTEVRPGKYQCDSKKCN